MHTGGGVGIGTQTRATDALRPLVAEASVRPDKHAMYSAYTDDAEHFATGEATPVASMGYAKSREKILRLECGDTG